jgi:hypothetical protein
LFESNWSPYDYREGRQQPAPRGARPRIWQEVLIFALYAACTCAVLWPLPRFLNSAVSDPGDPYINTWVLAWVQHAFATGKPLFHGNIFHPAQWSLTFTENLLGLAIPLAPLRSLGVSAVGVHNVGVLLGVAGSGWCAYILGRSLGAARAPAVIAGFAFCLLPWRFIHLPHVQHLQTTWITLIPAAWFFYRRAPSWGRACGLGMAVLLNALTNLHFAVFGAIGLGIGAIAYELWQRKRLSPALRAAIATFLCLLPLLPIATAYERSREVYGPRTHEAETATFSAHPADWLPLRAVDGLTADSAQERRLLSAITVISPHRNH